MGLFLDTTENAEGFAPADWEAWDAFLVASGEASIHLKSGVVRAALRSPGRRVRAARWTDAQGMLKGMAVVEDSEAVSQGVDDFLDGTTWFKWAKNWLHRKTVFASRFAFWARRLPVVRTDTALRKRWMSGRA